MRLHFCNFNVYENSIILDHVGLILGIEMSRLARSCKDWHQLLELCALLDTLLADPDGVYNPQNDNDRLRLGWKGTLSEAELHRLRQRMEQGRRNQARRGERFSHPPIGSVRGPSDDLQMDPGTLVRESFLGPTSVGIPSHESGARGSRLTDAHVSWSQEGIPAWMGARWESRTSEF